MNVPRDADPGRRFLGIEGGATHTRALMADTSGQVLAQANAGPANVQLLTDHALQTLLRGLSRSLPKPDAVAIGLAGARTETDRQRIRAAALRVWPGVPSYATNDLDTALMADTCKSTHHVKHRGDALRVLVLSGTGSCCYGRADDGGTARTGGWGHILGDRGSAYDIGLRALRETLRQFDRIRRLTPLGMRLLRRMQCSSPEEWVGWAQRAGKTEIAALTPEVFGAYSRDAIARNIIHAAAADLAGDASACAEQIGGKGRPVVFILAGGVLINQPVYDKLVRSIIHARHSSAIVRRLSRASVWGAFELARLHFSDSKSTPPCRTAKGMSTGQTRHSIPCPSLESLSLSPTEQRNPRSMQLSKLPMKREIEIMLKEDRRITPALLRESTKLERVIGWIVAAMRKRGRLFYVGAGTSGRLGVLDASECPPTFRTSPNQVQGVIAGGQRALWESIEGAEDDAEAGAAALRLRGLTRRDVVVGIAASGRTPFVWGAFWQAKKRGAKTVLVCFNPQFEPPRDNRPDLIIAPSVGPELLTGSTRLKSGTATKIILNLFTTIAMVKLGKVIGNLMVDLNPSNAKLRERAVRIVRQLTGSSDSEARAALERARWVVKGALRDRVLKARRGRHYGAVLAGGGRFIRDGER